MVNMNNLMKQAQVMQEKMQKAQEEISAREYIGNAGGEMVVVTLAGKGEIKSIKIDPSLCNKEEVEMLEDLVITAFKNAKKKLDDDTKDTMSGLLPPGMNMPF
jgi:nucleoid-associated protein EbfC